MTHEFSGNRRYLALWFPFLSAERLRIARPQLPDAPFALIGGSMVDRIGVRKAYLICMLVWSLTIPLTAVAWGVASFIVSSMGGVRHGR